jgi:hypothetical protein
MVGGVNRRKRARYDVKIINPIVMLQIKIKAIHVNSRNCVGSSSVSSPCSSDVRDEEFLIVAVGRVNIVGRTDSGNKGVVVLGFCRRRQSWEVSFATPGHCPAFIRRKPFITRWMRSM